MPPHPTTLPPPPPEIGERQGGTAPGLKASIVSVPSRLQVGTPHHKRELFTDSLLELSDTKPENRAIALSLSLIFQVLCLTVLILIPLFFTEAIDLKQFTQTMLVAPPPPPPPPPPPAAAIVKVTKVPRRSFMTNGKLMAPTAIPEKVAIIKEEALPPDVGVGITGGVPGGVPGGQLGGVMGGIIAGAPRTMPLIPVAPSAAPKAPVRVGGRIREPRLINRVEPLYPALAKQARVQGDVVIDAVISERGDVQEMKVVSGHPLLIPAALQALARWKYEPTYLNEEPIPVQLLVTIRFRLQ